MVRTRKKVKRRSLGVWDGGMKEGRRKGQRKHVEKEEAKRGRKAGNEEGKEAAEGGFLEVEQGGGAKWYTSFWPAWHWS